MSGTREPAAAPAGHRHTPHTPQLCPALGWSTPTGAVPALLIRHQWPHLAPLQALSQGQELLPAEGSCVSNVEIQGLVLWATSVSRVFSIHSFDSRWLILKNKCSNYLILRKFGEPGTSLQRNFTLNVVESSPELDKETLKTRTHEVSVVLEAPEEWLEKPGGGNRFQCH